LQAARMPLQNSTRGLFNEAAAVLPASFSLCAKPELAFLSHPFDFTFSGFEDAFHKLNE
jgi:hypothetical protein